MATLNATTDYRVIDNLQAVTLTNPDGDSVTTSYALKRNVPARLTSQGEVSRPEVTARWHVWTTHLGSFVPCAHGYVTDAEGDKWYIGDVSLDTWESRYALDCTLEAGDGPR